MSRDNSLVATRIGLLVALCLLPGCQSSKSRLLSRSDNGGENPRSPGFEQATEDLDYFFTTVEKVHFNHLANLSKRDYQLLKERSRKSLEEEVASKGHLSKRALALTVAEAAAALGDGHTGVVLTEDILDAADDSACMPPFRMDWQAGKIVISETCADLRHIQGARLMGINGKPVTEALTPILVKTSGDKWEDRMASFLSNQELSWALVRPFADETMSLTVQRPGEGSQVLTVNLITRAQYRSEMPPGSRRPSLGFYSFYDHQSVCYWQYNSCNPSALGREHIESLFRLLREHETVNLIVDLRYNPGGSDVAGRLIIDHLTSEQYHLYSRIGGRISDHLLRANPAWYLRPLKGMKLTFWKKAKRPPDVANRFEGSVYVITSPSTFSAASTIASVLKDYRLATLIGEETGGVREGFGDACSDRLPHSGVDFRVSCKIFYSPIPKADDSRRGTVPDIVLTEELLAPFIGHDDPELAFTWDFVLQFASQRHATRLPKN